MSARDLTLSFREADDQQLLTRGMANDDLPMLIGRVVRVVEDSGQRVREDGDRFLKGDSVFLGIGVALRRVPFELEAHRMIDSVPGAAQIDPTPRRTRKATCRSLDLECGSGLPDCQPFVSRRGPNFRRFEKSLNFLGKVARPGRFELPAPRLGGGCSIP
jgi:hypothetical protein